MFAAALTTARDYIRALRPLPAGGIMVHIDAGFYEPLSLTAADSGTAANPISYVGTGAVVSAGLPVPPSLWTPTQLPGVAHTVFRANLSAIGVTDVGGMGTGGLQECQVPLERGGHALDAQPHKCVYASM